MNSQTAINESQPSWSFACFLRSELEKRCAKNPHYSLRRFATQVNMDASLLSKIINGKRPMNAKYIKQLGTALGLSPGQLESFLVYHSQKTQSQAQGDDYQQLSEDAYCILSQWQYYGLLELMRVSGFKPHLGWIAARLELSQMETSLVIRRLIRLGMLEITENGIWKDLTGGKSTTLHRKELTNAAFKALQRSLLDQASQKLETVPLEERNHSSMTMAIDSRKMATAKSMIQNFQRELAKFLSQGESRDKVYNLSIALFPLGNERT